MAAETKKRIVSCPECGGQLVVEASTPVSYNINPEDGQWERGDIGESEDVYEVKCDDCETEWYGVGGDCAGLLRLGEYTAEDYGKEIED